MASLIRDMSDRDEIMAALLSRSKLLDASDFDGVEVVQLYPGGIEQCWGDLAQLVAALEPRHGGADRLEHAVPYARMTVDTLLKSGMRLTRELSHVTSDLSVMCERVGGAEGAAAAKFSRCRTVTGATGAAGTCAGSAGSSPSATARSSPAAPIRGSPGRVWSTPGRPSDSSSVAAVGHFPTSPLSHFPPEKKNQRRRV